MRIINVGMVAHVDAGKTTLTEQLLYLTGQLREAGSVDRGTASTDFLQIERQRGLSVRASSVPLRVGDVNINIIDTPGHVDFIGEVERSLTILDAAVLLLSAVEGVQPQSEVIYQALKRAGIPVVIVINKVDRIGSDINNVLQAIKQRLGTTPVLLSKVQGEGSREAVITPHTIEDDDAAALEALAEHDDTALEHFLAATFMQNLAQHVQNSIDKGNITPVFCACALRGHGIEALLDYLASHIVPAIPGSEALSAVVYRVTHDKTMGRLAHVRLFGGSIRLRDQLTINGEPRKVTQIRKYAGSDFMEVGAVEKGDIAALCGLGDAAVYDIIGEALDRAHYPLSAPLIQAKVLCSDDAFKVLNAFRELEAEDPLLQMLYDADAREITLSMMGPMQLEILKALALERYGLVVDFSPPTIIYKETPTKGGHGFEAYTMPKPCWAVIDLAIEPLPRGSGYTFKSVVPNQQMLLRYQHHVEQELPRALKQGQYHWEVTDLAITLIGGEHHVYHTHPMDFFLATPLALIDGLMHTGSTLLEPVHLLHIVAPQELLNRVLGDMLAMRGTFDSPTIIGDVFHMQVQVPVSTSLDYSIRLAQLSSGRALLSTRFLGYQDCPLELGATGTRRGVDPRDRMRWILSKRGALGQ